MNLVDYTLALRKALHTEGVGYTAYAIAIAVASEKAQTIPGLKLELGISSKGVRDCVYRRHSWMFEPLWDENPTRIILSADGQAKLGAISQRLPMAKTNPPVPRRRSLKANRASSSAQLLLLLS